MKILRHREFFTEKFEKKYEKIYTALQNRQFSAVQVAKLRGFKNMYRAKLDSAARMLFKFGIFKDETCILLLELIPGHAYDKSRFLRGAKISEEDFIPVTYEDIPNNEKEKLKYINERSPEFCYLDRVISFDDTQMEILQCQAPALIVGSAGSGKTVITLEKMKELEGDILYVTHSAHLAENARNLYFSESYENEKQRIDFLSFRELIETIAVPEGREASFHLFASWFERVKGNFKLKDAHRVFEEIRGVLTGSDSDQPYLSLEQYQMLGIKQSIFQEVDRVPIYRFFERYLEWLKDNKLYDPNIIAYEYLKLAKPHYHYVLIDEVQDFTLVQVRLILKNLIQINHFFMSGDAHQIVHPNFFSWAKLKSYFQANGADFKENIEILRANYRNSGRITDIANKILLLKQKRFGSVDKESNFLVLSQSETQGSVQLFEAKTPVLKELNTKTCLSTKVAVIVLRDDFKEEARVHFSTPLVFSVHEAKGLEYEQVILYNLISSSGSEYNIVCGDLSTQDLTGDLSYGRAKDKNDKSLEIYKFFTNALYVAMTRAITQVFMIEKSKDHKLLHLLGLVQKQEEKLDLKEQKSSLDEWQKEASKLELQGRTAQAELIRSQILHIKPVPWMVVNNTTYTAIKEKALDQNRRDKKAQHLLFEFAVTYDVEKLYKPLVAAKYSYASEPDKNKLYIHTKLYGEFKQNHKNIENNLRSYGLEYRNSVNETPLMGAAKVGHVFWVKRLLELGAKKEAGDAVQLTTFQRSLYDIFFQTKMSSELNKNQKDILPFIMPPFLKIKILDKMIKLDACSMEYFLLNIIISSYKRILCDETKISNFPGIKATNIQNGLHHFDSAILPDFRKKLSYISSILAKNECNREYPYNKLLFFRIKIGYYALNPNLEIEIEDRWVRVMDIILASQIPDMFSTELHEWIQEQNTFAQNANKLAVFKKQSKNLNILEFLRKQRALTRKDRT